MKTLSIIVPVYNEEKRVGKLINSFLKRVDFAGIKIREIIFVNDGSTDNSKFKIKNEKLKIEKKLGIKVKILSYFSNKGRGYAVRLGLLNSNSDYALYLDADGSVPLTNLKTFAPLMQKNYDLLFGSKKIPGAKEIKPRKIIRKIVGFGHSLITSLILGVFSWDFQGGFKMFSRRFIETVIPLCSIDKWGFDMEVIFYGKKLGLKTIELPIIWKPIENGTKVKLLKDIFKSLKDMVYIKISWINLYVKTRFSYHARLQWASLFK